MKPSRWFRNLPLKIGALVAAGLATLGFYGLIQASSADTPASPTATPTATPTVAGSSVRPTVAPITRQPTPMPRRRTSRSS